MRTIIKKYLKQMSLHMRELATVIIGNQQIYLKKLVHPPFKDFTYINMKDPAKALLYVLKV